MKKKTSNASIATIAVILIMLVVILAILLQVQNQKSQTILNLTEKEKIEDFKFLCYLLDESYLFWDEVKNAGINKEDIYAAYLDTIKTAKTDIAFFKELGYFLKEFKGIGHLSALDGYLYRLYVDTLTSGDGILTEQTKKGIAPLVDVLSNTVSADIYSRLDQSHSGFRSTIGLKKEYQYDIDAEKEANGSELVTDILSNGKIAYIKIPSFQLTNYLNDKKVLAAFGEEILDYPYLIIDLRGNSGGSDLYWQKLLVEPNVKKELYSKRYFLFNVNEVSETYVKANISSSMLIKNSSDPLLLKYTNSFLHYTEDTIQFFPAENPFMGEIFVLVDDGVYSASENFVMFCKNTGFATLVGTATGGDGGIADPMLVALPNSGLLVRFSIFYGLNADGTGNEAYGTNPDITIAENEDALKKCLSLIQ